MVKRIIAAILLALLCLGTVHTGAEKEEKGNTAEKVEKEEQSQEEKQESIRDFVLEESMAESLKALGVFNGVSDTEFALERAPTRTEALVMLIRLLGREEDAKACTLSHPFTDVPSWANSYVAYAYHEKLTQGETDTFFGADDPAEAKMFLTFVLRALGYSDGDEEDFSYDDPFKMAQTAGILPDRADCSSFFRGDVVLASYAALSAHMKDSDETLADCLINEGTFTKTDFTYLYDGTALKNGSFSKQVEENVKEELIKRNLDSGLDISGMNIVSYSTVVQIGDAGYEKYGLYKAGASRYAERLNTAAELMEGKGRVFCLVAPNSLGVMLSKASHDRVCKQSQGEGIAYTYGCMDDSVYTVDAYSNLRAHNSEYVYFRTDHHWTALGAYYAYREWAKTAGFEPTPLEDYQLLSMPGHLGLFYSLCKSPYAMRANPDRVDAYIPKGDIEVEITNRSGSSYGGELVYDCTNSSYKYGAFIGGDNPLTTITNNDIEDDSSCLLIKDSYGNPFAVYLAAHYKTVYVVDYRYYGKLYGYPSLTGFADDYGVDDVIVVTAMTLSQSDGVSNYLSGIFK